MRKIFLSLTLLIATALVFTSCSSEETYAEQRDREINNIENFIAENKIEVIGEDKFAAQGYTTESNQYVLINKYGVYMNIVHKGTKGTPLAKGKDANILVRYQERNLSNSDGKQSSNMDPLYTNLCDKFYVKNTSGTFIATYTYGALMDTYGSKQVPGGWLVPLKYVNLGDDYSDNDEDDCKLATVRLIVPHDQGTAYASSGVYAYFYYLTYQLDK